MHILLTYCRHVPLSTFCIHIILTKYCIQVILTTFFIQVILSTFISYLIGISSTQLIKANQQGRLVELVFDPQVL